MRIYTYIYIYIYIYIIEFAQFRSKLSAGFVCECMRICIYIYIYFYMYVHIYIYICIYVHIYDKMQARGCLRARGLQAHQDHFSRYGFLIITIPCFWQRVACKQFCCGRRACMVPGLSLWSRHDIFFCIYMCIYI